MSEANYDSLAQAFQRFMPCDARFLLCIVESTGTSHMMSSLQNGEARIEVLEHQLAREREKLTASPTSHIPG